MDELYIFDENTVKCYSPPILFSLYTYKAKKYLFSQ